MIRRSDHLTELTLPIVVVVAVMFHPSTPESSSLPETTDVEKKKNQPLDLSVLSFNAEREETKLPSPEGQPASQGGQAKLPAAERANHPEQEADRIEAAARGPVEPQKAEKQPDKKPEKQADKAAQPDKDECPLDPLGGRGPAKDEDWGFVPYHPPGTGVAPGFRKRLMIALTAIAVGVGGLFALNKIADNSKSEGNAPRNGAINKKEGGEPPSKQKNPAAGPDEGRKKDAAKKGQEPAANPDRGGNVIRSVDHALELAQKGMFQPLVREIENPMAGNFTYQFTLKESVDPTAKSRGAAESRFLRGVVSGPEREKLLKGLSDGGFRVESEVQLPQVVLNAPPREAEGSMAGLVLGGLSLALMGGMLYIFYRSYRAQRDMMSGGGDKGGLGGFTRHQGDFIVDRPKERFTNVGGCPEVVEEMKELKHDIQETMKGNPKIKLPRGAILSGGPGTGKTLLARSLAGEVDCPFLQIDSSQSTTAILVGTGQMRVKSAFDSARNARDQHTKYLRTRPGATGKEEGICIIFFDEFDSIGSKRQSLDLGTSSDAERKNVVNALLNELDGIDASRNRNIVVMAATNFRDDLDPALMRPGRFTKKIDIPLPTSFEQRLDIIEKLSEHIITKRGKSFEDKESLSYIARITPGKSGDDLRAILEEASSLARRDNERDVITNADMFEAYQRHLFGRPKPNLIKPDKHELVIRHEIGHALCAMACDIDVFLMSAVPRGDSAGRVVIDPEGIPEMLATKKDMLAAILLTAGGRAAELEGYGKLGITAGADGDLEQIRNMVARMVSSGLFDGMYSQRIYNHHQSKWQDGHVKLVDDIVKQAVSVGQEIIKTVGPDRMTEMAQKCRKLEKELVGPEAQQFFETELGPELMGRIKMVAQKFYENPVGESRRVSRPAEDTQGDSAASA